MLWAKLAAAAVLAGLVLALILAQDSHDGMHRYGDYKAAAASECPEANASLRAADIAVPDEYIPHCPTHVQLAKITADPPTFRTPTGPRALDIPNGGSEH